MNPVRNRGRIIFKNMILKGQRGFINNYNSSYGMKVLMISTDRNIFMEGTEVRERMVKYGRLTEELHIIVFSKSSSDLQLQKISENTWVYPTNSFDRWFYVWSAVSIGKKLLAARSTPSISPWLVTAQDPFLTGLAGYRIAKR